MSPLHPPASLPLSNRSICQYWRNPVYNFTRMLLAVITAIIFGSGFINSGESRRAAVIRGTGRLFTFIFLLSSSFHAGFLLFVNFGLLSGQASRAPVVYLQVFCHTACFPYHSCFNTVSVKYDKKKKTSTMNNTRVDRVCYRALYRVLRCICLGNTVERLHPVSGLRPSVYLSLYE